MQSTQSSSQEIFLTMERSKLEHFLMISGKEFAPRISDLLINQLRYGIVYDKIHIASVIDEIICLEGGRSTSTEPANIFRGGLLRGFWKKHFFQSSFLATNLLQAMKIGNPKSQKFQSLVRKVARTHTDLNRFSKELAHKFVMESYEELCKKKKLTGEWIVFARFEEKNYYLSLASHSEETDAIFLRIKEGCFDQFPFLFASS